MSGHSTPPAAAATAATASAAVAVERAVARLVAGQSGVITHAQLVSCGLDAGAIDYRARAGRLFRVHRGVYALSSARLSDRGRWLAARLACGPRALLSHRTAAAVWRLTAPGGIPHVTVVGPRAAAHGAIATHRARSLSRADIARRDGIPLTAVPRTLLDCAATEPARAVRRMIEEADRKQLLHGSQLQEMLARSGGHHGCGRLRALASEFTVALPTRSELEDRCLELLHSAGIARPRVNASVAGYEIDLYWPSERFAIELDGHAFHRGRAQARRDRRKEEALDRAGIALRRFDWWQVTDDGSDVVAAVRRGLAREDAT